MIIKIGTTEFALGTNRNEPSQVQGLEGSRVLNVVPLTRSAVAGVYDQENVSHALSVVTTRHHATAAAACDFVLSHPAAALALTGDVVIESPSGNKWKLTSAKLEKHSLVKWIGRTTVHAYTFRGGTLTAVTS